jgi:hypothetical protein
VAAGVRASEADSPITAPPPLALACGKALAVAVGVLDASTVGASAGAADPSAAGDPTAAGDTAGDAVAASAVDALEGVAANTPAVAAAEALTAAVGASVAAVIVGLEAAAVASDAGVASGAATLACGRLTAAPPGRIAAISAARRARSPRRTCRTAATTTAAIAANARHSRAIPHMRLRLGRAACTDTLSASDGGRTVPDVSSADFTASANRSSMSLFGAKLGLGDGWLCMPLERDLTSTSRHLRFRY